MMIWRDCLNAKCVQLSVFILVLILSYRDKYESKKVLKSKNLKRNVVFLRNEFHFSGVRGAMNRSGSRAK